MSLAPLLDAILTALPVAIFGAAAGAAIAAARRREAARRRQVSEVNTALAALAREHGGHYSEGQILEHPWLGPLHTCGRALLRVEGLAIEVSGRGPEEGIENIQTVLRLRLPASCPRLELRRAPQPTERAAARAFLRCFVAQEPDAIPEALQARLLELARHASTIEVLDGVMELSVAPPSPGRSYLTDVRKLGELTARLAAIGRAIGQLAVPPRRALAVPPALAELSPSPAPRD